MPNYWNTRAKQGLPISHFWWTSAAIPVWLSLHARMNIASRTHEDTLVVKAILKNVIPLESPGGVPVSTKVSRFSELSPASAGTPAAPRTRRTRTSSPLHRHPRTHGRLAAASEACQAPRLKPERTRSSGPLSRFRRFRERAVAVFRSQFISFKSSSGPLLRARSVSLTMTFPMVSTFGMNDEKSRTTLSSGEGDFLGTTDRADTA